MYVVVSIDRATQYCCAYGPYHHYFDANALRIRMNEERPDRTVYVVDLKSAR